MTSTKKQIVYTVAVVGSLIAILGIVKYLQISKAIAQSMSFAAPPEAVTSMVAEEHVWPATFKAVGSLVAVQGAILGAESSGAVAKINFESGDFVEAGAVLVELDTSVEEANLRGALAMGEQQKKAFDRAKFLRSSNSVSQAELETAEARTREANASVDSLKATISRKRIIAPFSGRTGIRKVNIGDFVSEGAQVVPLYSLDPLYVNFTLPEQSVTQIGRDMKVNLSVVAFPGVVFEGKITSIDPQIDMKTRNVGVQATVSNPEEKLRPGMYADVTVILPKEEKYIVIPVSSITYAPYGNTAYIIETKKDDKGNEVKSVRQQVVKLGPQRGNQVAVISGINSGEEVVTSGTFKLRAGANVVVDNSFAPSNDPHPSPANT